MLLICLIIAGIAICVFFYVVPAEKRANVQRFVLTAFSLVALCMFIFVVGLKPGTLYTVEARTEYVEYISTEKEGRLNLSNVSFLNNFVGLRDSVFGSVSLLPGVKMKLYRIGQGPLKIYVSLPQGATGPLGVLENDSGRVDTLVNEARFELKDPDMALKAGKSHLIYFNGREMKLGKNVAKPPSSASSPILYEAVLTANQKVLLGSQRYESLRFDLGFGETLSFDTKEKQGVGQSGLGFAVIDGGAGLKLVYNINAENARVSKAGLGYSDNYLVVKPTLLNRLTADSFLQTISFFFAGLLVITTLWTFYYDTRGYHKIAENE